MISVSGVMYSHSVRNVNVPQHTVHLHRSTHSRCHSYNLPTQGLLQEKQSTILADT